MGISPPIYSLYISLGFPITIYSFFHTPPMTTNIFGYLRYNICLIYSVFCGHNTSPLDLFNVDLQTSNFGMWLYFTVMP
jgi:hypothetical protein